MQTPRRRFTSGELAFYTTLINLGGPLVFKFVSDNLYGPCLRTVRGARTDSAYFRLDSVDENVLQVFTETGVVTDSLARYVSNRECPPLAGRR